MTLPRGVPLVVDAFIEAVGRLPDVELHSLMVVRHGQVVAERWWAPYDAATPHQLYSLSKSFTSTALGFAVAEGLVDLDATVLSYFPELNDAVTDPRARAIKVRHVAAMASGHDDETADRALGLGDGDMLRGFLQIPPDREPGTVFAYNQPCTYAVASIVQRVSGSLLTEFLRPRLFEPLGIERHPWWRDRFGRELGYAGLFVTTETIAELGQLYLDRGRRQGRQLLPERWIEEATRSHIANGTDGSDWSQGYGFQFWRSRHGYRGDGAYGQFMLILPEVDAVVAITSQSPEMAALLDAVWSHLLPVLTAEKTLPEAAAEERLPAAAAEETLPVPGGLGGALEDAVFGAGGDNELASLRTVEVVGGKITLRDDGPEVVAELGEAGAWTADGPVATAWARADGLLLVDVIFVETPHRLHLRLDPAGRTFAARWQSVPLGDVTLARLRIPS